MEGGTVRGSTCKSDRSFVLVGKHYPSACAAWPLQNIVLLLVACARVNRPVILPARLHCPHWCNTIARLSGNIRPPLGLPLVCHTPYQIGNTNIV